MDVWQFVRYRPRFGDYAFHPVQSDCGRYKDSIPACKGARGTVAVSYTGEVYPCNQMSGTLANRGVSLGNVKTTALHELLERGCEYVVMAGYMRMVHTPLLAAFPNRVVNLHPALLPSFTGAHAIDDAFARGVKVTGVTVHFANEIYDNGPIIAQRALAVEEGWDVDTLEEHIHAIEHVLYPEVVQMLADGRVHVLESGKVAVDPVK